jgi:hypothetical protein
MENNSGMVVELETKGLTAQDRCDRCMARAYVEARFMTGTLLFCMHHANELNDGLHKNAIEIVYHSISDML